MQINYVIVALAAAGVIIAGTYFLSKKRKSPSRIEKKTLDKLTLFYIKEFFQQDIQPLAGGCKAVVLKVNKEQIKKLNLLVNHEYSYYVLTYYDTKNREIKLDRCTIIETKDIDSLLAEAFGDKDMLILE